MKTFNIAKSPVFDFLGAHIPKNGVWGNYDGLTYICADFRPIVIKRNNIEYMHYRLRVYNPKTYMFENVKTCDNKRYYKLANYLTKMITKCGLPCEKFVFVDRRIVGQPREKQHQVYSDSPFRVSVVGYALNPHIMTNGVAGWADWK